MENKSKNILIALLVLVIVVLVTFFLLNKNNKEKIINEEVKGEIVLTDLKEKIKTEAPEWSNYWIGEDTGSNLSMFIKDGKEGSITQTEYPYDFKENRSELREKKSYYIYSPDKTKILDPYGQVFLGEENGKIVEYLDVDSSVKLIDLKTNKFKQILTCGTPCGFGDAFWVGNNNFVVLGGAHDYKDNGNCKIYKECQYPTLYVFDLLKNSSTLYNGPEILLDIKSETLPIETYTYKNHGFTIELPKGYIPHEEQAEGGPAIMITLPNNSGINYLTDMNWWNKVDYFGNKKYLKDEKIGETLFKVYQEKDSEVLTYSYVKGDIGYVFFGDKNLLETFKFVGWAQ